MKIKLIYFKRTGKYYSEGEYESQYITFHEIITEVRDLKTIGKLPGLVEGANEFMVYVVPSEEWGHGVPHIIP